MVRQDRGILTTLFSFYLLASVGVATSIDNAGEERNGCFLDDTSAPSCYVDARSGQIIPIEVPA